LFLKNLPTKNRSTIPVVSFFGISLINKPAQNGIEKGRRGEGFTASLGAKRCLHFVKSECASYYNTLFERKAAPPLCIVLCCITIASYVLTQH
jgi:hypothetical protein